MMKLLSSTLIILASLCTPLALAVDEVKKTAEDYENEAKLRMGEFKLPEGFTSSLYADSSQTQNPSAICFDEKGALFVAEIHRWREGVQDIRSEQRLLRQDVAVQSNEDRLAMYQSDVLSRPLSFYSKQADRIVRIVDGDRDGRADSSSVWADGFNDPLDGPGIGLLSGGNGSLFYTNIPHLWKLEDADGDGKAEKRESIQSGFGVRMSLSGHDMHGLIRGPDGKIYWSIGDRGSSITTKEGRHYHRPYEGSVFRCNPDGSDLEEFCRGLRNPQELAFDQYGNLFTCDNDADAWDSGRLVYLMEGSHSGWDFGHQALLIFRDQLELRTPDYDHPEHASIPMNRWMTEGLWETDHPGRPSYALPPVASVSWGPSGMVYNYGATAVPARYAQHFWICNFGGANADLEAFSVKEKGAGFALDQHEVFMKGMGLTDVEFGPDGRMYLSCFNNNGWYKQDIGNIYSVYDPSLLKSELILETGKLLLADFEAKESSDLLALLAHGDMRVRQKAQFALVAAGDADGLAGAAEKNENQLARIHGIWGIGQLLSKNPALLEVLLPLLEDEDAEIRAQAAKVIGDSRLKEGGVALVASLKDDSARVQSFAAIGVGKCRNPNALPGLLELLAQNDNQDPWLRHACVEGMWFLNEREKILKKVHDESGGVRMGVLLTLRKLLDPRVKYFLNDEDSSIRDEAIRAINDLDLTTAIPDLASQIEIYLESGESSPEVDWPEDHRDWMIHHRLINANFRLGGEEEATRLLRYAGQKKLPEILRNQALLALQEWASPSESDPTTGLYRPIDPSTRIDIGEIVRDQLPKLFSNVQGATLALATELALQHGAKIPVNLLVQQIGDENAELSARLGSIRALLAQDPALLDPQIEGLFQSSYPEVRAEAAQALLKRDQDSGILKAKELADSENLRDRQNAFRLLSELGENQEIDQWFAGRLRNRSKEPQGALLDLLEAAEKRKSFSSEIEKELGAYQASLDASDPLAAYLPCLEGGDVARGRTHFMTHALGQCAKCHRIDKDGGEAGPDLSDLGGRSDARYILESLVNPSAVVVPGYGMTMVSLKNGETLGGTLAEENEEGILLRYPDPADANKQIERRIAESEIATRQPPVSAMPPMLAMQKRELRDLVAYLSELGKKKKAPKKEKKSH